jgi:hypothetical protein
MTKLIIGLIGDAGAGKSTVARYLESDYEFEAVRFAGGLKKMMGALGLSLYHIEGEGKEKPTDLLGGKTPRYAMQTLGTEWGRDLIGENFWVDHWRQEADKHELVVVEDCRFPNEAQAIRDKGGYIVKVVNFWQDKSKGADHASEHQEIKSDFTISNVRRDRLDHLYDNTDEVLELIEEKRKPKPKRIYLSGPMTGLPAFNYPVFNAAAARLRAMGHTVYNPTGDMDTPPAADFDIREAFAEYTAWICKDADAIAMLPGWNKSSGALAEYWLAVRLGLEIIEMEIEK